MTQDDVSNNDIDPSDQSAIESFTQHSKYTTSRMGISRFMPRHNTTNQQDMTSLKRSPLPNRRDPDDSSSLSPLSNDHNWMSQTKSFITNNNNTNSNNPNRAINRTVGSDNPLNKLTTNIP